MRLDNRPVTSLENAGTGCAAGYPTAPFILCGVLKIAYDLALLWAFRHIRPPEEQAART